MTTLTRDSYGPELEKAYAATLARCMPINPRTQTMARFEIRFSYTVTRHGNAVTENDKHTLDAESSPAAHRAFTEWFNDAYQGATLRSTSILQVPGA